MKSNRTPLGRAVTSLLNSGHHSIRFLKVTCLLVLLLSPWGGTVLAQSKAQGLYAQYNGVIFRIEVITKTSDAKNSLGTGFVVADGRTLATNFHVISEAVHEPALYKLEWVSVDGRRGPAEIVAVDVVHDLALLKTEETMGEPMQTAPLPEKGAALFSLGHPLGLDLAIITGTANGLLEKSIYEKIHFSGNINPGMSGGPAINEEGRVVGVNVASAGEAVGFLVPAKYLDELLIRGATLTKTSNAELRSSIGEQLYANQQQLFDELLNSEWDSHAVGAFKVPDQISERLDCWGSNLPEKDDQKYSVIESNCLAQDSIYLSRRMRAGTLSYQYFWLETEQLSPRSFYSLYERRHNSTFMWGPDEDDVGNFTCAIKFVEIARQTFKANVCARPYLDYPNLVDFMVLMAMTGHDQKGFLYTLDLSTVTLDNAMRLYGRFLESMTWQP